MHLQSAERLIYLHFCVGVIRAEIFSELEGNVKQRVYRLI